MVDLQQQVRLHELCLNGRGAHRDQWLTREHGRALRHGPDIAGEAEVFQIVEKCLAEQLPAAQIGNVLVGEVQVLDVVDDLLETGGDGVAAVIRYAAEEHVKVADALAQSGLEVPVAHGELIEVAQHGQICLFFHPWGCLLFGVGMLRSRPRGCQHPCVFSLLYLEKREKAREKGAGPGLSGGISRQTSPERWCGRCHVGQGGSS